jgi:hypothetical protein
LLLQRVSNVLRILPAWQQHKDANFENLRARVSLLVSADQSNQLAVPTTVEWGMERIDDPAFVQN